MSEMELTAMAMPLLRGSSSTGGTSQAVYGSAPRRMTSATLPNPRRPMTRGDTSCAQATIKIKLKAAGKKLLEKEKKLKLIEKEKVNKERQDKNKNKEEN